MHHSFIHSVTHCSEWWNGGAVLDRNTFLLLLLKSYLIESTLMISFLFWEIFICTVPYRLFSCIVAHLFSFGHLLWISYLFSTFNGMALNSLHCARSAVKKLLTHSLVALAGSAADVGLVDMATNTWHECPVICTLPSSSSFDVTLSQQHRRPASYRLPSGAAIQSAATPRDRQRR